LSDVNEIDSSHATDMDEARLATLRKRRQLSHYRGILLSGLTAVGCVFVLRSLGLLQFLELSTFDRLIQLRPVERRDDRMVIVGFSEADFQEIGSSQITDAVVAEVLTRISAQKPQVIGLDLYRSLATPPGREQLQRIFKTTPNLIGIEKVIGRAEGEAVRGNPILVQAERIAASDVIADVDGRVRRAFLFPSTDQDRVIEGLGLRVALEYLATRGIQPNRNSQQFQLDQVVFPHFRANDGGYHQADAGGYQMLLNLRGRRGKFRLIPARDVLNNKVPSDTFRNRIVMIGDISIGGSDLFFTSYSSASGSSPEPMSGVELHANIASQILSAVLDQRPLMRSTPEWFEWSLIVLLTYGSAWLGSRRLSLWQKAVSIGVVLVLIGTGSYGALLLGWWLPLVPTVLGVAIAASVTMSLTMQQLSVLSTQDSLTLLANRRIFDETLEREWKRALRSRSPIGLILCDVDYFKPYNDTYGHAKGDECLRQVAMALQRSVRRSMDLAARYGGEEFVVLLPNTDIAGTLRVAKLIQAEVQALQLEHRGSRVSPYVSLSLGMSSVVPSTGGSPQTLLEVADAGLYEAKQKGRNQVVMKLG
jgi:diguanylate cyclase (GGDEF)-like protein